MILLLVGLILFFGSHSISIVAPLWRDRAVLHVRDYRWKGLYSLVTAAGLALLLLGYAQVRHRPPVLYVSPSWMRDVVFVLMLPVFPLLLAAYVPGHIRIATKHPLLVAVKLWATAHLLINGTLAEVLFFGSFLLWAIIDRISLKRRNVNPPVLRPPSALYDVIAVTVGLGLYVATIFWLHGVIIGAPLLASSSR
jgi:uncharacterized membrane protein